MTPSLEIKRLYVVGAGASCPYGLPALARLSWDLSNSLGDQDRKIFLDAIYECIGREMRNASDSPDFEELLDRLDPRALDYVPTDNANEIRPRAAEIALRGLRNFINLKCSEAAIKDGPYDRLVGSLTEHNAIVTFNWDVLLELAFRRQARPFFYWDQREGSILLKPHGSINWFALLDRELLRIDAGKTNWDLFGHDLTYYMLFLKDPLGSQDLGGSSEFVRIALSRVPAIVPPVASRMLSVGGTPRDGFVSAGHERAMKLTWRTFQELVQMATELVVIGYSLPGTDAGSISILRQFAPDAESQARKTVFIVDKNRNVVDRYRRLVHPSALLISDDFSTFDPTSI